MAAFLANAANKFFVRDLEYEAEHHFYERIFDFRGDAPDQYRIVPLLPLKVLTTQLSFNYAVLLYNALLGFLAFELFYLLMAGFRETHKYAVAVLFAVLYIFFQYTGWRPDTMGLLVVCAGSMALAQRRFAGPLHELVLVISVALLTFCRADIALVYGLMFAAGYTRSWPVRTLLVLLPIAGQFALQSYIFPEAAYYSQKLMLGDNLRFYYLLRHPATYLILAVGLIWWGAIRSFLRLTFRKYLRVYLLLSGYIFLVLFIGRLNEYRLYLPFLPIFLAMASDTYNYSKHEKGARAV
ncbi:MAG: hypothetical protein AAF998_26030 [Bacteroidota bacterium]